MVKCSVLRELELTCGEMLKQKTVSKNTMPIDAKKYAAVNCLQRTSKYYTKQTISCSSEVFSGRYKGDKTDRAGGNNSGNGAGSLKGPEINFNKRSGTYGCSRKYYMKRCLGFECVVMPLI